MKAAASLLQAAAPVMPSLFAARDWTPLGELLGDGEEGEGDADSPALAAPVALGGGQASGSMTPYGG